METPKEYDLASAVFENGPVHNEVDGEDIEDDEEEAEDQPMSASQLLGLSDINGGMLIIAFCNLCKGLVSDKHCFRCHFLRLLRLSLYENLAGPMI